MVLGTESQQNEKKKNNIAVRQTISIIFLFPQNKCINHTIHTYLAIYDLEHARKDRRDEDSSLEGGTMKLHDRNEERNAVQISR